ncbi:MAG: protein kinase [Rhodanobacteraceae bacterium]|nr:protein kinase [Rhodanobacteraceae bacterium]
MHPGLELQEFHVGDRIDSFSLEARIDGGGQGHVWRARDLGTGTAVALKLFPACDLAMTDRAKREFDLLVEAATACPDSFPTPFGAGRIGSTQWIAMSLAEGNLARYLHSERDLPFRTLLDLLSTTIVGLKWMHSREYVHRDLKPENILVDGTGTRLCDLGTAKVPLSSLTGNSGTPCTPAYAAPEIINGSRGSVASDQYSFALVLLFALGLSIDNRAGWNLSPALSSAFDKELSSSPGDRNERGIDGFVQELRAAPGFESLLCRPRQERQMDIARTLRNPARDSILFEMDQLRARRLSRSDVPFEVHVRLGMESAYRSEGNLSFAREVLLGILRTPEFSVIAGKLDEVAVLSNYHDVYRE